MCVCVVLYVWFSCEFCDQTDGDHAFIVFARKSSMYRGGAKEPRGSPGHPQVSGGEEL